MSGGCTYSLTQQQTFKAGLQCSGAAKQQRHQRDCVNALLQRMKQIWRQGGRGARLSDRSRDSTKALHRSTPRADAWLAAARRSGRDRIQAALMYIWTLTLRAYIARSSTYTRSDVCMCNFWTKELKRWDNGGSYGEKKTGLTVFDMNMWTVHVSRYHTLKLHTRLHTSHTGASSRPLLQLKWPST